MMKLTRKMLRFITHRRNRLHHSANHIPPVMRTMMLSSCLLLGIQSLLNYPRRHKYSLIELSLPA